MDLQQYKNAREQNVPHNFLRHVFQASIRKHAVQIGQYTNKLVGNKPTYFEKKIKNKNYKLGNRPYNLPHRENFKYIFYIIDFLKYINIFVIIGRNLNNWKILLISIINIIIRLLYKLNYF